MLSPAHLPCPTCHLSSFLLQVHCLSLQVPRRLTDIQLRSGPPRPPPYLRSTEDLLTRFQLLPAYDKYVRPFAPPVAQAGAADKGKGKEILPSRDAPVSSPAAQTPAAGNDGDEEDGAKGEKKHKNYKYLVKSVPGMSFNAFARYHDATVGLQENTP